MIKALKKYYDHFGENYPLVAGNMPSEEEVIKRINYCIEHDTPEAEPEYEEDCDY